MNRFCYLTAGLVATCLLTDDTFLKSPVTAAHEADPVAVQERLKHLTERLRSPIEELRQSAAVLLGQLGRLAEPTLTELTHVATKDRSARVRKAAGEAIARIKRGEAPTVAALATVAPAQPATVGNGNPAIAKSVEKSAPAEPAPDLLGVCFVLDCSLAEPSLAQRRKTELLRAIEGLPNKQIFTVLLATEGGVKLPADLGGGMSQATASQKARVAGHLAEVEPSNRTQENLPAALAAAAMCRPEIVCLVTAQPLDYKAVEGLLTGNNHGIRFSVIAISGSGKKLPGKGLQRLAEGSGGKLLVVEPESDTIATTAAPTPTGSPTTTAGFTAKPRVKCQGCNSMVEHDEGYCFSCELAGKRVRSEKPAPQP